MVPFRARIYGLSTEGDHPLDIAYDATNGGKHAYDYLASFNATERDARPCEARLCPSQPNLFPIPTNPNLALASPPVTSFPGSIAIYNGTITRVEYLQFPPGPDGPSSRTAVRIAFSASRPQVLIAWGGHIASHADWGAGHTTRDMPGVP